MQQKCYFKRISKSENLRPIFVKIRPINCVKSVQIQSPNSCPYFPVFGLNTVNLCMQSKYRKTRTGNNSIFGHFSCSDLSSDLFKTFLFLDYIILIRFKKYFSNLTLTVFQYVLECFYDKLYFSPILKVFIFLCQYRHTSF